MKFKWLLFDADGTLFDFERAQEQALKKTFSELKIDFTEEYQDIYKKINKNVWEEKEQGLIDFKELKRKRFALLFSTINVKADPLHANAAYLRFLSQLSFLLDGAEELVRKASAKYKMVLLTNGLTSVQKPRFANSPITKYFKTIIISEEVGVSKPDNEIFDLCFERIQQPAKNEVLMIGDNLGSDILGGINYGIDTCWYNPTGLTNEAGLRSTYEVADFEGLKDILDI